MSQHRKTVYAGRLVQVVQYSVANGSPSAQVRAGKLKATTEAQRKLNFRHSYEKLALILAANFPKGSDIAVLEYDDEHLPKTRKRIDADLKAFRKRAEREWRRRGKVFRMAWAVEDKHGGGRPHVHIVVTRCGGDDSALIYKLWGKGQTDRFFTHLRTGMDENHISLARYMAKEAEDRANSRHTWHVTKNCVRPVVDIEKYIPDGVTLAAPKGAMVLEQEVHRTEHGCWSYLKYYVPEDAPEKTQRMLRAHGGSFI